MSTQYPVLDNRPINKWKVVELKEELKRRNLATKGLKDDLVKRLDEAIRKERECSMTEEIEDIDCKAEPLLSSKDAQVEPSSIDVADDSRERGRNEVNNLDDIGSGFKIDEDPAIQDHEKVLVMEAPGVTDSVACTEGTAFSAAPFDISGSLEFEVSEKTVSSEATLEKEKVKENKAAFTAGTLENDKVKDETMKSFQVNTAPNSELGKISSVMTTVDGNSTLDDVASKEISSSEGKLENDNMKENEVLKPLDKNTLLVEETGILEPSAGSSGYVSEVLDIRTMASAEKTLENSSSLDDRDMTNDEDIEVAPAACVEKAVQAPDMPRSSTQVYEVTPNLGSEVGSDSIFNETLSFSENMELKNNLNVDNVPLEPEIIRPEMVQPSSTNNRPTDGMIHSVDDKMPHGDQGFVGKTDDGKSTNAEFSNKNNVQLSVGVTMLELDLHSEASNRDMEDKESTQFPHMKDTSLDDDKRSSFLPGMVGSSAEHQFDYAASVEERTLQDAKCIDAGFSKTADGANGDHQETINLYQSSADDSMEEDLLEAKNAESDHTSAKVGAKAEQHEVATTEKPASGDRLSSDVGQPEMSESSPENKHKIVSESEKRKFKDEGALEGSETRKRLRRWNNENVTVSEPQNSNISLSTPSKDLVNTGIMMTNLSGSDSVVSGDTPRERIVPPSSRTATSSLRIDNFLRPFTLKAVQQLLAETGTVCNFWMDHIKTHCYVTYSSVEEAIETRNAVYNLQWPQNGGRLLIAEFVDPREVKSHLEAPSQSTTPPISTSPDVVSTQSASLPPAHQQARGQQHEHRHPLSRQPLVSNPPAREGTQKAHSPVGDRNDPPILTLDDLFKKTKATPRIYYLPLTDEQVSAKLTKRKA